MRSPSMRSGPVAAAVLLVAVALLARHRRRRERVLEHAARRRMLEIVEASPGVETSELADRLGHSINTVLYHGRLLAEADAVTMERIDGRVAFFPAADRVRRKAALVALRQPRRTALFDLVASAPGINVTDAAEALEVGPDTLRYHVDVLDDRGVIDSRREGRRRRLFPTPVGRDLRARIGRDGDG